ncbi:hypothetical protein E4U55_003879 [Claviceps digitariae]|nr:hypothetical protein E4U55_003879 [Claviceps digitariae]
MSKYLLLVLVLAAVAVAVTVAANASASASVAEEPEPSSSQGLLSSFVSLSVELSSFQAFAGTKQYKNKVTNHLIKHLSLAQNAPMVIRVGGNSADHTIFDKKIHKTPPKHCRHPEQGPSSLCIGRHWFRSYAAFAPNTVLSHAFNLATWNSSGWATLNDTGPLVACKYLRSQASQVFEVGNQPDLYQAAGVRPASYSVEDYLSEWREQTARLENHLNETCPDVVGKVDIKYMFPSISSPGARLHGADILQSLTRHEADKIGLVSVHHSMGDATQPGVTMEATLMNHTAVVEAVKKHVEYAKRSAGSVKAPYVIGQLDSLDGGGAEDLTDTFGAALWAMDFALCAATSGVIKRLHFHQAIQAPSAAWWAVRPVRTKATFYGMLAAATFLADSTKLTVKEFDVGGGRDNDDDDDGDKGHRDTASGYSAFLDGELRRVAILNLKLFDKGRRERQQRQRQRKSFLLDVGAPNSRWLISRLTAPTTHAKERISFNGFHYSPDSMGAHGQAVSVVPKDSDEAVWTDEKGVLLVHVADSEAVVLLKNETNIFV